MPEVEIVVKVSRLIISVGELMPLSTAYAVAYVNIVDYSSAVFQWLIRKLLLGPRLDDCSFLDVIDLTADKNKKFKK